MSCAFLDCDQVLATGTCALEGGCIVKNPAFVQLKKIRPFGDARDLGLRDDAPALNGTQKPHDDRHPSAKIRKRKALV